MRISLSIAIFLCVFSFGAVYAQTYSEEEISAAPECRAAPGEGETILCSCSKDAQNRSLWGANPYTSDSDICTAARHAGVVGAQGGGVIVTWEPGQSSYAAASQNGIDSHDWGEYGASFRVSAPELAVTGGGEACATLPEGNAPYACTCEAGERTGSVWGSGPYTADSDICTAAQHAGVVGQNGGAIVVTKVAGQAAYNASTQNGVTTREWGEYGQSITISAGGGKTAMSGEACDVMPEGVGSYTCSCANSSGGAVWGSDPFTADSDICSAAVHADALGPDGSVTVLRLQGLPSYQGSTNNGVTSLSWDSYESSITFNRN